MRKTRRVLLRTHWQGRGLVCVGYGRGDDAPTVPLGLWRRLCFKGNSILLPARRKSRFRSDDHHYINDDVDNHDPPDNDDDPPGNNNGVDVSRRNWCAMHRDQVPRRGYRTERRTRLHHSVDSQKRKRVVLRGITKQLQLQQSFWLRKHCSAEYRGRNRRWSEEHRSDSPHMWGLGSRSGSVHEPKDGDKRPFKGVISSVIRRTCRDEQAPQYAQRSERLQIRRVLVVNGKR
jgi:hypothetical protein